MRIVEENESNVCSKVKVNSYHWCKQQRTLLYLTCAIVFHHSTSYAENELLLPSAVHLPGCVCDARRPPGPALPSPPRPSFHHPVGGRSDQGLRPGLPYLHLPRKASMDEQLWGAPELRGPLLPLPGVHLRPEGAGAVHAAGTVGVALLGKGEWMSFAALCGNCGYLQERSHRCIPLNTLL